MVGWLLSYTYQSHHEVTTTCLAQETYLLIAWQEDKLRLRIEITLYGNLCLRTTQVHLYLGGCPLLYMEHLHFCKHATISQSGA